MRSGASPAFLKKNTVHVSRRLDWPLSFTREAIACARGFANAYDMDKNCSRTPSMQIDSLGSQVEIRRFLTEQALLNAAALRVSDSIAIEFMSEGRFGWPKWDRRIKADVFYNMAMARGRMGPHAYCRRKGCGLVLGTNDTGTVSVAFKKDVSWHIDPLALKIVKPYSYGIAAPAVTYLPVEMVSLEDSTNIFVNEMGDPLFDFHPDVGYLPIELENRRWNDRSPPSGSARSPIYDNMLGQEFRGYAEECIAYEESGKTPIAAAALSSFGCPNVSELTVAFAGHIERRCNRVTAMTGVKPVYDGLPSPKELVRRYAVLRAEKNVAAMLHGDPAIAPGTADFFARHRSRPKPDDSIEMTASDAPAEAIEAAALGFGENG